MNTPVMFQERAFSKNRSGLSVGLANIPSRTNCLEDNKRQIIQALEFFSDKNVNLAIFPEYCFSGYFREPVERCLEYMETTHLAVMEAWFEQIIAAYINDNFKYIVLNGLEKNKKIPNKFFNTTIVLDKTHRYLKKERSYKKRYIPDNEKTCLESGVNDTLILETPWGNLGFLTCYDICFPAFAQELIYEKGADALVVSSGWRKQGTREYKNLHNKELNYYQHQWNVILQALALQNQVWVMAANAVGPHSIEGLSYCGCSGIWAPSGLNMIQASDMKNEYLILHNIDIKKETARERQKYSYIDDFKDVQQKQLESGNEPT